MFQVNSSSPGQVSFSGSGTASYNNSVGTNNSINLGSASQLSLSGSVSGTPDYQASSSSLLNLDSSTTFTQSVGTASDAANTKSTVDAVSKSAHDVAYSAASSAERSWEANNSWGGYASAKAAYEGEYNRSYENAFTRSYSRAVEQDSSNESTGTVSGEFTTANKGRAVGAAASVDYDASASANAKYGYNYDNQIGTFSSEAEWEAAWDAEYAAAYSRANGDSSSTSTSSVNVEGIGNVASVTVGDGTSMDVDMGLRDSATDTGQNGSANGSANLTLNTASTAAVSNSQFASGFIQAFEAN